MKLSRLYILLTLILASIAARAQVSLEVASQVEEGKNFNLTIKLTNMSGQVMGEPQIPNCRMIYSGAQSTSSSNGSTTHSVVRYSFTYHAEKAGTVTIPSITVVAGGKEYHTKAQPLKILPQGSQVSSTQRTTPIADVADGTVVNSESHFSANDMFVRITLNKNTVYEQEPVVATIKLYTRLSMGAKFQLLTQPTFEGFLSEELDVKNPQGTETVDGKAYNTFVVKQCVLYPQKSGELKLTSGTYEITLQDQVMFNSGTFIPDTRIVSKQVQTPDKTATLKVLPLPTPQPASYDGAVGSFTAVNSLSATSLRTNEPVTYTISISGTGNIKYLKTPKLNLPGGIDQYTPKSQIDANYSGGDITGTYTVTYTLVPMEVGKFEIPPIEFTYFNPSTKEYKTETLKGFTVNVAKGDDTAGAKEGKSKKMTDIYTIHPVKGALDNDVTYTYHQWWYWMLYVLAAAGFAGAVYFYRRRIRLNADVQGRKLARALRLAMKRFKTAKSYMHKSTADKFYAEINKALWGYLSDKLAIPSSQLVRDNIAEKLAAYGVDQPGIENIINILDDCEMARFTPMDTDTDMSALYDKVVNAVKSIEDVKK